MGSVVRRLSLRSFFKLVHQQMLQSVSKIYLLYGLPMLGLQAMKAENESISESGGPLKMEIHVDKEQSTIDIQEAEYVLQQVEKYHSIDEVVRKEIRQQAHLTRGKSNTNEFKFNSQKDPDQMGLDATVTLVKDR
ncbi:hypothetical protein L6452_04345 [Arctium lappa]|uniref:Uncharacterized protein n=1 Tax=Arctium lappa TaxID=4217 RepID=A0ACB9FRD1_ARCLA|nr:hypothetical protein L6452_04345 [Arctium lappa]